METSGVWSLPSGRCLHPSSAHPHKSLVSPQLQRHRPRCRSGHLSSFDLFRKPPATSRQRLLRCLVGDVFRVSHHSGGAVLTFPRLPHNQCDHASRFSGCERFAARKRSRSTVSFTAHPLKRIGRLAFSASRGVDSAALLCPVSIRFKRINPALCHGLVAEGITLSSVSFPRTVSRHSKIVFRPLSFRAVEGAVFPDASFCHL